VFRKYAKPARTLHPGLQKHSSSLEVLRHAGFLTFATNLQHSSSLANHDAPYDFTSQSQFLVVAGLIFGERRPPHRPECSWCYHRARQINRHAEKPSKPSRASSHTLWKRIAPGCKICEAAAARADDLRPRLAPRTFREDGTGASHAALLAREATGATP